MFRTSLIVEIIMIIFENFETDNLINELLKNVFNIHCTVYNKYLFFFPDHTITVDYFGPLLLRILMKILNLFKVFMIHCWWSFYAEVTGGLLRWLLPI